MKKVLLALISLSMLSACTLSKQEQDEYDADHEAYTKCIENEPSIDDCVYDYVKYLPEEYQEQIED
jgi:hypothetical protein